MRRIGYTLGAINLTDEQLGELDVFPTKRKAKEEYRNMLDMAGDITGFVGSIIPGIHDSRLVYYKILEDDNGKRRYVPTNIINRLLRNVL